ncbi:MAG: hypothetical protein IT379_35245 [Deltaproteobacteria bacterium]|nr:hypothetical protein [Deltaproteobacteria bacterium]
MVAPRHSVELVLLPVLDIGAAVRFYAGLGFAVADQRDDDATLEVPGLQLVLERVSELEADDGRPRAELRVPLPILERAWRGDERDDRSLPGPTLAPEGVFEYRVRDPSGNRVRLLAVIPDSGSP